MENNISLKKRTILLADDSVTIHKVVNLTFADGDIEVVAVTDGDAAMRKINESLPDLVMVDVNMPGADGYQICESIKHDDLTKHIPVILLVGSFEPFDEEKARRVGADDFLTKPFQSILQLVNKVSDLLARAAEDNNFLAPIENPSAPITSFADTLKMMPSDAFDSADASIENLGDAGMDDEMIQTAQADNLPSDEATNYESAPVYQSFAEDLDLNNLNTPYTSDQSNDYPPHEDWATTQPLSKDDLREITGDSDVQNSIPNVDFDELDLLEFSQRSTHEIAFNDDLPADSETENKNAGHESTGEFVAFEEKMPAELLPQGTLSPETIDAIADRVVERLSSKVIKKLVRETVAQMERRK